MTEYDSSYLNHILDSITRIEKFIEGYNENQFKNSELVQSAVIRQIEIIGEATKHLSEETRKKYPNIPWKDMMGMRDKLIPGSFGVDTDTVLGYNTKGYT